MDQTGFLIPMVAMIIIWYFLLIRPQQRRAKEHRELVNNLKKKDQVITQSGIYGTVVSVTDTDATIEIASGVNIRVVKSMIQAVTTK